MNDLPSTEASWSSRRSSGASPSSRAATSACSVSGTSSASIGPVGPVDVALAREQAAVEQHPYRLDRVERDALGAAEDLRPQLVGQAGNEARRAARSIAVADSGSSESVVTLRLAGAEARPALGELGPARARSTKIGWLRDHSSRYSTKSSSAGVGPLQVLEHEDRPGRCSAIRSKKSRHAAKRSSRSRRRPLVEAEQVGEPRLEPARSSASGDVHLDRGAQLRERRLRRLVLGDPRAHPHHLGERPVGDALAVGEAAAAVPPEVVGEPVDVLLELPGEPRLADAGDADDRDEVRLAAPPRTRGRAP